MRSILIFSAGGEDFGLPVEAVLEVRKTSELVKVPHAPDFIEGISHVRGRPVAILDLAKRLGKGAVKSGPQNRFVITKIQGNVVGLLVDSAREVLEVETKALAPVQAAGMDILDLQGRLVPILRQDDLLSETEGQDLGKEKING